MLRAPEALGLLGAPPEHAIVREQTLKPAHLIERAPHELEVLLVVIAHKRERKQPLILAHDLRLIALLGEQKSQICLRPWRHVPALGIALVVALGAPAIASLGRLLGAGAVGVTTGAGADGAASTPVSDWRRGEVPFLYQTDPTWANEPYAGGTIRENGCGPTCLAMVYVDLTGKTDHGPAEMAALSERSGYTVDGMTAWAFMAEGAAELGLSSSEVPADADRLRAELEAGDPVIASVRPGDFTTTGHFIVLAGVNKNGELIVHDPNSPERSAQTWDIERVLNQCNNLWAFSA